MRIRVTEQGFDGYSELYKQLRELLDTDDIKEMDLHDFMNYTYRVLSASRRGNARKLSSLSLMEWFERLGYDVTVTRRFPVYSFSIEGNKVCVTRNIYPFFSLWFNLEDHSDLKIVFVKKVPKTYSFVLRQLCRGYEAYFGSQPDAVLLKQFKLIIKQYKYAVNRTSEEAQRIIYNVE